MTWHWPLSKVESMDHFCVAVNQHIGVVSDYDQLPPQFVLANLSDHQVVNKVIVQVVLGLIQYKGFFAECKQKRQQRR